MDKLAGILVLFAFIFCGCATEHQKFYTFGGNTWQITVSPDARNEYNALIVRFGRTLHIEKDDGVEPMPGGGFLMDRNAFLNFGLMAGMVDNEKNIPELLSISPELPVHTPLP